MEKSAIIWGSVSFLAVVILGAYFFSGGEKPQDLIAKRDQLQSELTETQIKLDQEEDTLENMKNSLRAAFPLGANTQDQMKKASSLVAQTDLMFTGANDQNPKLKVKNPLPSIPINEERKNINLLLAKWKEESDILSIKKIDPAAVEETKKEMEIAKSYLEDLSEIIESLTPQNSELSQTQIDIYSSELPAPEDVDEVVASLEEFVTQTGNDQSTSDLTPNTPPVSPEEVVAQQTTVIETQTQVEILQEQLAQVEEQIEQSSTTPPPGTITIVNPEPEDTGAGDEGGSPEDGSEDGGIIIQPGPPRLIQGTNPF